MKDTFASNPEYVKCPQIGDFYCHRDSLTDKYEKTVERPHITVDEIIDFTIKCNCNALQCILINIYLSPNYFYNQALGTIQRIIRESQRYILSKTVPVLCLGDEVKGLAPEIERYLKELDLSEDDYNVVKLILLEKYDELPKTL